MTVDLRDMMLLRVMNNLVTQHTNIVQFGRLIKFANGIRHDRLDSYCLFRTSGSYQLAFHTRDDCIMSARAHALVPQ